MLDPKEILIRLALASLFGALIGLERERKSWAAGLRTHMMVCVGSCLIMIVSAFGFADIINHPHVTLDPSRIAAQVVSGIGFIGAGTILFLKQNTIRGLTTAAGLWTVAAIGLATGGGLFFAAAATTFISLIILWAIQPLEKIYLQKFKNKTLRIITNLHIDSTELLKELFDKEETNIQSFTVDRNETEFIFELRINHSQLPQTKVLLAKLENNPNVKEVFWV